MTVVSKSREFAITAILSGLIFGLCATSDATAETPRQDTATFTQSTLEIKLFSRLEGLWMSAEAQEATGKMTNLRKTPNSEPDNEDTDQVMNEVDGRQLVLENTYPPGKLVNIGLFEGEQFGMCGHDKFSARLSGLSSGQNSIVIKSRDRTIPGIPFRGFEERIPLETKTELWPGCSVIAGFVEVAGIIRIGLSVRETRSAN